MPRAFSGSEKLTRQQKKDRQAHVYDLHFKGYNKKKVVALTGYPEHEVDYYLKVITKRLTDQADKAIAYRRNRVLGKISLVQQKAWEIEADTKNDSVKLAALRVVISSHELEAKVEGVTQEKVELSTADSAADTLNKKLIDLEQKVRQTPSEPSEPGGNGHKEEKLPEFLGNA